MLSRPLPLHLLRSRDLIAIATAHLAIAAQIYPGGKTTHSVFKASLTVNLVLQFR